MNSYFYTLCDREGDTMLEIRSAFTVLQYDDYFDKYIRPLLPTMSQIHGKAIYLDNTH